MSLQELENLAAAFPKTEKMPVLFLGHGSPMNAIEENRFTRGFRSVAGSMPKPNAILCISAHWYTRGTMVTAMEKPKTIHDFGGFPKALYEVQYPAPGSPQLASTTKELLAPVPVTLDNTWGLDHGAWSVIKHLYPEADVPVIQLSIDYTKPPQWHYALAASLAVLRERGILIVGSGNIIHNLGLVDFQHMDRPDYGYDWAIEARETFNKLLISGDHQSLLLFNQLGLAARLAIPTPDHYLPLLYILGLKKEKEELSLFNDELLAGSLSMTSVKIS